jgi:hypothetical protein
VGTLFSAATNNNGYFEITNIPENTAVSTIKNKQTELFTREIKNVNFKRQCSTRVRGFFLFQCGLEIYWITVYR